MDVVTHWASRILEISAALFVFFIGCGLLAIIYIYIRDVTQTKQAIRRNYPVIGRFRYWFEHMGEFFRQYFFAQDREELPFDRAHRSWVYRAAKNVDSTVAFGSTRPLNQPGDIIFLNCPFPTLTEDTAPASEVTIGESVARKPFTTSSFFNISGMSFGALSVPAVLSLSKGAKKAGIWMNTGEGGLSPYHLEGGADIIFQIGTAKYGVRDENGNLSDEKLKEIAAHDQVRMFEIKMSQGAKPGKGGILPGNKVNAEISAIRGIPEGQDSISPNGHTDIQSIDELLDMIARVREVTGKPVGFKAVIGAYGWLDDLMEAIHARGIKSAPDFITLDSADGGTGAAPQSLMDYMGLPIKRSLPLLVDILNSYGLKQRIKVIVSGKLINPAEVAWAMCIGADFIVSARGFMFSLGCIQALQCNKNTCPTGITTHDPKLQKGLVVTDKAERVAHYAKNMMYEVGVIAHSCGVKEPRRLKRFHAQMINDHGLPQSLDEMHPPANVKSQYQNSSL
ncbi:FMN-binding glutamate synthase family protein [Enterovibrio makurazakiensis]|uniref:FMN-binding glutamate synthase family protein n=1 Tax=Enterovibrio gelatinilyticus TaxID=2899819 RepID=A0ABT5R2K6_9GAMM|nr:FMN-binding glutamate synthase family protein [Enterovibrio sp. ZSDZ42]MDD1794510.1 FMN-binding glutamate synthase family protein [Enterovibrio sp. ZSDZ42]